MGTQNQEVCPPDATTLPTRSVRGKQFCLQQVPELSYDPFQDLDTQLLFGRRTCAQFLMFDLEMKFAETCRDEVFRLHFDEQPSLDPAMPAIPENPLVKDVYASLRDPSQQKWTVSISPCTVTPRNSGPVVVSLARHKTAAAVLQCNEDKLPGFAFPSYSVFSSQVRDRGLGGVTVKEMLLPDTPFADRALELDAKCVFKLNLWAMDSVAGPRTKAVFAVSDLFIRKLLCINRIFDITVNPFCNDMRVYMMHMFFQSLLILGRLNVCSAWKFTDPFTLYNLPGL